MAREPIKTEALVEGLGVDGLEDIGFSEEVFASVLRVEIDFFELENFGCLFFVKHYFAVVLGDKFVDILTVAYGLFALLDS